MNLNFGRCQPIDDVHGRPWSAPRSRKVYPMNVYLILGARKVRRMILASVACWAALFGCVAAAAETKPLRLQIDQDVSIQVRGHTIVTYRATPSPNRPFLRELWTPGGVQVLRDSPHDHKHHHGMMFALSVDGIDFWCDEPTSGRQVPKTLQDVQVGGAAGTSRVGFTQPVDWVAPSGTDRRQQARDHCPVQPPKVRLRRLLLAHSSGVRLPGGHAGCGRQADRSETRCSVGPPLRSGALGRRDRPGSGRSDVSEMGRVRALNEACQVPTPRYRGKW